MKILTRLNAKNLITCTVPVPLVQIGKKSTQIQRIFGLYLAHTQHDSRPACTTLHTRLFSALSTCHKHTSQVQLVHQEASRKVSPLRRINIAGSSGRPTATYTGAYEASNSLRSFVIHHSSNNIRTKCPLMLFMPQPQRWHC